ncbi:Glutamate receptor ionotropic, kainate glr-3 [Formica fusca]
MKHLFLSVILPCVLGEICLRFLRDNQESKIISSKPGHVWLWNAMTEKFEQLEALKWNNTAFCSVNAINDIRGKTLFVATEFRNPYIIMNVDENEVTGLIGDTWMALEEALKFKTIYRSTRPSLATLMNGDTHALLVATAMYSYPTSYYTYSVPLTTNSYALFVQSEGAIVTRWWYINIFSHGLWLASLISVICIAFSIVGIYRIKKLIYVNYKECNDELSSLSFSFLYVLGGMTGQGFEKIPRSWSLRLIILSFLAMGMLLSCGFCTALTSCLASKGNSVPLTNLKDVVMKRTHTLCVRKDSSAYRYFTVDRLAKGDLLDHWKGLVNNDCPDMEDSANFASKLCRPGFVYLETPAIFQPIYHKVEHNCQMIQLPETYWSVRLAFLHARVAQHRRLFDTYLMRMRSAGILRYLEKKWIPEETYSQSNYPQSSNFQPVEYAHIHLTINFFSIIIVISVFICILENVWYRLRWKKKNFNSILEINDNNLNVIKVCHKARSRYKRSRKLNSILLSENVKSPAFLQNVTVRTNRW